MAEIDARLPQLELIRPWDAVILAAGDFPSSARALQALREAPHLVCCDGAWEGLRDAGLKADRVIGDGDSLTAADKAELGETFVHISEQESNDLTKALRYASAQGWTRLLLLGATGKREDHTLGNISLLVRYNRMGLRTAMLTDRGLFIIGQSDAEYTACKGQQISVFNIDCCHLSSEGLVYPVRPFDHLWQGTLNEAQGETFRLQADGCYLLYCVADDTAG